jgi:hypothetical protein
MDTSTAAFRRVQAHDEGLLHRGVWVAVVRSRPNNQAQCAGPNQMQVRPSG